MSSIWSIICIWASTQENLSSRRGNNKVADQPAHPYSLISAFVIHYLKSRVASFGNMQNFNILASLCSWWDSLCQKPQRQVLSRNLFSLIPYCTVKHPLTGCWCCFNCLLYRATLQKMFIFQQQDGLIITLWVINLSLEHNFNQFNSYSNYAVLEHHSQWSAYTSTKSGHWYHLLLLN